MWAKYSKGFTAIELMTVVVIIGILASLVFPRLIAAQNRAKDASTKANLHSLQNILELYGVDWGSTYPVNVSQVENEPSVSKVLSTLTSMKNPYSLRSGNGEAYDDEANAPHPAGMSTMDGFIDRYFLYGYDNKGLRIQVAGQDFVLSNSH